MTVVLGDWLRGYTGSLWFCFFFQAEDGIRDLVRSRGLGDVYKRQAEKLFGWTRKELMGQPVELLLPERFRKAHGTHRALSLIHI